jgi:hypothetical protein
MHRSPKHSPNQYPEKSRQEAELGSKHWTDKRACSGDGCEMMAKEDEFIGRVVVLTVAQGMRRSLALWVENKDLGDDELGVKPVRQRKDEEAYYYKS